MTINIKNFLSSKNKMSKMGEFQNLKQIEGLEMSATSADLYKNGRDDLVLFYFKDLSLALGQTDRIPLILAVWAPVLALSLFALVGVLQINEK